MTGLRKYKLFEMGNFEFLISITTIVLLVGLVGWLSGVSGQRVTSFSHQIGNITQDSSFNIPTFKVQKGEIYRIQLKSGQLSNTWLGVGVSLQDDDDLVINEFEAEFWHESGRDSDGYWSESDYREISYFKATKTEELSGEVYWAGGSLGKKVPQVNTIKVQINAAGSKVAARYFERVFWGAGVLLLILISIYGKD